MTPYYSDGLVTIYHGDALELDVWDVAGGVMVTDPPYGISHSSNMRLAPRRGEQIANDHDTTARDKVLEIWTPRPSIVFGSCRSARLAVPVRAVLVWDKGGHVGTGDLDLPWKPNWEHIYVSGPGFVGRRNTGVLRFNAVAPWIDHLHPHEKPVELMRELVGKCAPLAVVVDPFAGAGSTLRAAKDLGRATIGVEIEERYCELAARRCSQEVLDFGGAA